MNLLNSVKIIALLLITQQCLGMQWLSSLMPQGSATTAKNLTLVGAAAGGAVLAYKLGKHAGLHAHNNDILTKVVKDNRTRPLAGQAAAMAPVLRRNELQTYRNRKELLPAIVHQYELPAGHRRNLRYQITWLKQMLAEHEGAQGRIYEAFRHNPPAALAEIEEPFPLIIHVVPSNYDFVVALAQRSINLLTVQSNNADIRYTKNTPVHTLIGRPLARGEFALITYSDGDQRILLHNSDRELLNNLTDEQRDFIVSLWNKNSPSWPTPINYQESRIYRSLSHEMQINVHCHYNLSTFGQRCTRWAWSAGLLGFGLARAYFATDPAEKYGRSLFMTAGCLGELFTVGTDVQNLFLGAAAFSSEMTFSFAKALRNARYHRYT